MPWKEQTVKIMREDFVKRVLAHEKSKSELCREYGISRPTGDKWIKRYQEGEAMNNKSRTPHSIAKRKQQYTMSENNKLHIQKEWFDNKTGKSSGNSNYQI